MTSISIGAAYGLSDDLTIGFSIPYIKRENIREDGDSHDIDEGDEGKTDIEELGNSSGIGDAVLYGQYRFINSQDSKVQSAFIFV